MLRPRDFVGNQYFVRVQTDQGNLNRCVDAFDREDAIAQMLNYCAAEGLTALSTSVI